MSKLVLGIESSCDETAAAVLADGRRLLSNVVASQDDVHAPYGGVVPELASRRHIEVIVPVVDKALTDAGVRFGDLDGIAVTYGPGLVGSLLVGCSMGKALAWVHGLPLIGVNHLEGHIFASFLTDDPPEYPFVALVVSGGHTALYHAQAPLRYRLIGQTRDDAAGEAFDKVAKLLGLGYPGGAAIERLAREGRPDRFRFPRPMRQELDRDGPHRYDFSFSGLKTAVLRVVRPTPGAAVALGEQDKADIAWAFQDAATDVLVAKTAHATLALGYTAAMIGGGVACNRALVTRLRDRLAGQARVSVASPRLNTDNAAMIAAAGAWRLARGERSGWDLEPRDDLPLPGLIAPTPVSGSDA
jgi:N6-L-threonylcarbamoyladenine synthase